MPVIECPHCGTQNDAECARCQKCGWLLLDEPISQDAGASSDRALPPIPDGGLATQMPDWLRVPLGTADTSADERIESASTSSAAPEPAESVGENRVDPREFLTEDDFPAWIRQLATPSARHPVAPVMPWDEEWAVTPPALPPPSDVQSTPRPAVFVPQPALPQARPEPAPSRPTEPPVPAQTVGHHDWGRLIGLCVIILILLGIGLLIILISTNSFL